MSDARQRYERRFAESVGAVEACAFGRGRQALVVLLKALGAGPGDRVGLCGYTCLSVPEAVKVAGCEPVYLDVDDHLCIDPASLARLERGSLKVLVLQHTFGLVGRLDALLAEAERIGAVVVEDACHSLGTRYRGRHVGSFGAAAIYSFQWGKPYSTGQGGMLCLSDPSLADAVGRVVAEVAGPMSRRADWGLAIQRAAYAALIGPRSLALLRKAYHGLSALGLIRGSFDLEFDFSLAGYVRLAGPSLCRAGLRRLERWPEMLAERRRNAETIAQALRASGLPVWPPGPDCEPVMLRYPIRTSAKAEVLARATEASIDLAGWYATPVHPLEGEALRAVGYEPGTCPRAEDLIRHTVTLPTGPTFSPAMLEKAIGILRAQEA